MQQLVEITTSSPWAGTGALARVWASEGGSSTRSGATSPPARAG